MHTFRQKMFLSIQLHTPMMGKALAFFQQSRMGYVFS